MTVNFSLFIEDSDFQGFEIHNIDTGERHHAPDYERAQQVWVEVGATPQSWWSLSAVYLTPKEFDVNMSESHAREVLAHLGINDPVLSGSMDPEEMLGRCLVGSALAVDTELPAYTETGANGARLIDHGRARGYVSNKLVAIEALCHEAKRLGREVAWG